MADGNFLIPQVGFAESLNISVACAVSLFEAQRQRALAGFYEGKKHFTPEQQEALYRRWKTMLVGKSWLQQYATPVGKDSAPLLPVFVERDEHTPKKNPGMRPNPMTKFDL